MKAMLPAAIALAAAFLTSPALAAGLPSSDDSHFTRDVLASSRPVVVDFYADWCGPCRRMTPTVLSLSNDYKGKVRFLSVNIDDSPLTAEKYGISAIPTVAVFRDGRLVSASTGVLPKPELAAFVAHAIDQRITTN